MTAVLAADAVTKQFAKGDEAIVALRYRDRRLTVRSGQTVCLVRQPAW